MNTSSRKFMRRTSHVQWNSYMRYIYQLIHDHGWYGHNFIKIKFLWSRHNGVYTNDQHTLTKIDPVLISGHIGVNYIIHWVNTLRPRQNGRPFADDNFKHIFLNENVRISSKISLKFVPEGPINNILALVQIMAWRRPGDKPLSEPMMVRLSTHIRHSGSMS